MKSDCIVPVQIQRIGVYQFFSFTRNGEEVMMKKIEPYSAKQMIVHVDHSVQRVKKTRIVFVNELYADLYND